jgi:geranylgeranyl diphosphate synthase type I
VPPVNEAQTANAEIVARIDAALAGFMVSRRAALAAAGPDLEPVGQAAHDFVFAGGKRIRPLFAYWGWRCVHADGADDEDALIEAAASLELLHAAALVHDDLIDDSATRRGQPAAHSRFAALHREGHFPGSDLSFGTASAILLGDLLLSWSGAMLSSADLPRLQAAAAREILDTMSAEMMAGQYLDVLEQARGRHSVQSALRVARFKSSKYTVERPLQLGATAAGANNEVLRSLSDFGVPLGEAFQLRDDVLGVFGDPSVIGKPAGDDLREGKRTVLVALAHQGASEAEVKVLEAGLGDHDLDADGVDRLRSIIVDTGALAEVEQMISIRRDEALYALSHAIIHHPARRALTSLAHAATDRHT